MSLDLSHGKKIALSFLIMGATLSTIYIYWTHHENEFDNSSYQKVADSSEAEVYQYRNTSPSLQGSNREDWDVDTFSLAGHILSISYPSNLKTQINNIKKPTITLTDKKTFDLCSKDIIGNVSVASLDRESIVCLTRSRSVNSAANGSLGSQSVIYTYTMNKAVTDLAGGAKLVQIYPQITFNFDQQCKSSYTTCDVGYEQELVQNFEPLFAEILSTVSVTK